MLAQHDQGGDARGVGALGELAVVRALVSAAQVEVQPGLQLAIALVVGQGADHELEALGVTGGGDATDLLDTDVADAAPDARALLEVIVDAVVGLGQGDHVATEEPNLAADEVAQVADVAPHHGVEAKGHRGGHAREGGSVDAEDHLPVLERVGDALDQAQAPLRIGVADEDGRTQDAAEDRRVHAGGVRSDGVLDQEDHQLDVLLQLQTDRRHEGREDRGQAAHVALHALAALGLVAGAAVVVHDALAHEADALIGVRVAVVLQDDRHGGVHVLVGAGAHRQGQVEALLVQAGRVPDVRGDRVLRVGEGLHVGGHPRGRQVGQGAVHQAAGLVAGVADDLAPTQLLEVAARREVDLLQRLRPLLALRRERIAAFHDDLAVHASLELVVGGHGHAGQGLLVELHGVGELQLDGGEALSAGLAHGVGEAAGELDAGVAVPDAPVLVLRTADAEEDDRTAGGGLDEAGAPEGGAQLLASQLLASLGLRLGRRLGDGDALAAQDHRDGDGLLAAVSALRAAIGGDVDLLHEFLPHTMVGSGW